VNILGIETSCDETAAAVVRDGRHILSNVIRSQAAHHAPYGGVVPEIASRQHAEAMPSILQEALKQASLSWDGIDAVAVTYGPGLATSLMVGLSAAKGLAFRLRKPLVAINHIEAHMYSVFLGDGAPSPADACPLLALVVSGGHTCLVNMDGLGRYRLLGQTVDDAAGEAFDKGSNLLGLGYPGGPAVDKAAKTGDARAVAFPRGRQRRDKLPFTDLDPALCFSFSGLKTALLYYLRDHPVSADRREVPSIAASYQEAIVEALVERCDRAIGDHRCLAVSGGVSLNSRLRTRLAELAAARGIRLLAPSAALSADNAAMVAGLAGAGAGVRGQAAMEIDIEPNLRLA
jgi:N6-L-threonylcarbamoyladenine synthase